MTNWYKGMTTDSRALNNKTFPSTNHKILIFLMLEVKFTRGVQAPLYNIFNLDTCWEAHSTHCTERWAQKILPAPGFNPQTVQPIV